MTSPIKHQLWDAHVGLENWYTRNQASDPDAFTSDGHMLTLMERRKFWGLVRRLYVVAGDALKDAPEYIGS